jgi:transcriptional regulator with XRE-family HTH domain
VAQGGQRSYRKVARATGVSVMAVRHWARSFDWPTRARLRDAGIARQLAKRTDQTIVQVKARYHAMINKIVEALCKHHLGKDLKSLRHPEKTTLTDLERLVRLDLMLLGEPDLVARLETGRARELDTALSELSPAALRALVQTAKQLEARTVEGEVLSVTTEAKDEKERTAAGPEPGAVGGGPAQG